MVMSNVVPLMWLITCPQLWQHLLGCFTRTFQWRVQRSVTPGECLTSLPVPLTHCTRFHVIPTGWVHLELCSHTQTEEDLLKFLMGSTVTFLILLTLHANSSGKLFQVWKPIAIECLCYVKHSNIPNSRESILSPLYVVTSLFAGTYIYSYTFLLQRLFLYHTVCVCKWCILCKYYVSTDHNHEAGQSS